MFRVLDGRGRKLLGFDDILFPEFFQLADEISVAGGEFLDGGLVGGLGLAEVVVDVLEVFGEVDVLLVDLADGVEDFVEAGALVVLAPEQRDEAEVQLQRVLDNQQRGRMESPIDGVVLVTTPQALVGMIVQKALKMTELMNIPVMGIVENMSYAQCSDCHKRIDIFGESKLEQLVETYGIPLSARLPIDPKLASGFDRGLIELFEGNWLDALAEAIADLPAKEG